MVLSAIYKKIDLPLSLGWLSTHHADGKARLAWLSQQRLNLRTQRPGVCLRVPSKNPGALPASARPKAQASLGSCWERKSASPPPCLIQPHKFP